MSGKEKKAIYKLKSIVKVNNDFLKNVENQTINQEEIKAVKIILDIIEKQQKEIEELKNIDLTMVYMDGFFDGEKKLKDKLREIIKEKAKTDTYNFKTIDIKDLEEILGE